MEFNREIIIKALEFCTNADRGAYCPQSDCPYGDVGSCEQLLMCHALSLIKELTEENERLEAQVEMWKSTAYCEKDRVESVKIDIVQKYREALYRAFAHFDSNDKFNKKVFLEAVDQIAEEMVEGKND